MWLTVIGIVGATASVIGAILSIKAANKAISVKKAVEMDYQRMTLAEIGKKLACLQDELNTIEDALKTNRRGFKLNDSLKKVRRHLDGVLNSLDVDGEDSDIRDKVAKVQVLFVNLEQHECDRDKVVGEIRVLIQESISIAQSRSFTRIPTV